ncbi:MAG: TrmB family transcriptional regulator [Chloroflexi bacterium]|nr:TrmB family transcriptional regulator [Chloroflexota bacterium]
MDAAASLRALGFTQHEASIYVFLLRHPLSTGYEVSKGAGLPRANVYQVLESLGAKEAVQAVSAEPARYAAIPPAQLLAQLRREAEQRHAAAQAALAALDTPPEVEQFWNLRGAGRVRERFLDMADRAAERVIASLWAEDLDWARDALRRAHDRGATVVVNLFGDPEPATAIDEAARDRFAATPAIASALGFDQLYRHEASDRAVGGHVIVAAVDFTEALAASLDAPAGGVYTQNATLVRLVEKLVRDESYLAAIYAELGPELEARFGPHLVELRRRLLPPEQADRLLTIVSFGRRGPRLHRDGQAGELLA